MDSSASPSGMTGSCPGAFCESEKMKFTNLANFGFFHLYETVLDSTKDIPSGTRFLTMPFNLSDKVFEEYTLDDVLYGIKVNGDFGLGTRVPYWEIAEVQHPFIALQHIARINGLYIVDTTDLSRGRRAFINLYFSPYTRKSVHPLRLDVVPYNNTAPLPEDWHTLPAFANALMYIQTHNIYQQMLEEDEMTQEDENAIDAFYNNLEAQEEFDMEDQDDGEFDDETLAQMADMEKEMDADVAEVEMAKIFK